jgi:hypothetical protein
MTLIFGKETRATGETINFLYLFLLLQLENFTHEGALMT